VSARGRIKRGIAVLPLAAAVLLAPVGAAAEGESARQWLRPSLRVTTVGDDNLFLEDGNGSSSVGVWLNPRLEAGYEIPGLALGADVGIDVRRYADYHSSLAVELYRVSGHAQLSLAPGLSLRIADAYVPQPAILGRPGDEGSNLLQTNRVEAGLSYWHELPGSREIEVGVKGTHFLTEDFPEPVPQAGVFVVDPNFEADFLDGSGYLELRSAVGERSSAFLRGNAGYRSFRDEGDADHSNYSVLVGIRSSRWENADVELSGGWGRLDFAGADDADRVIARASLNYRLPAGFHLALAADHLISADLAGEEVAETTGRIGLERYFGTATAASLRFFVTRFDADSWRGGANLFGAAELRVRRQLTRHSQLSISYRHWRNDGSYDIDDFSQNRVAVAFTYRL
jgi:hypothetical protein